MKEAGSNPGLFRFANVAWGRTEKSLGNPACFSAMTGAAVGHFLVEWRTQIFDLE
jgi:hypothetical protein